MKVILRPRQTGRTQELTRLCAEAEARGEVSYIVCFSDREARRIFEEAKEHNLIISFPITIYEFLHGQYTARNIQNFFIDNVDHLLQSMTRVHIRAVTMEEEDV